MKKAFFCCVLVLCPFFVFAQPRTHQEGTIVRMRMTDCMEPQHGFMAAMSGGPKIDTGLQCPEYVLVTDKVVYVIIGKTSDQLIPLAEGTRFRFQKNEMLIRVDDAPKECHFHIKAMMMRPDWDRAQRLEEAEANALIERHLDVAPVSREQ
jgi:hypothetical protein